MKCSIAARLKPPQCNGVSSIAALPLKQHSSVMLGSGCGSSQKQWQQQCSSSSSSSGSSSCAAFNIKLWNDSTSMHCSMQCTNFEEVLIRDLHTTE
jgi:hypothetical protein